MGRETVSILVGILMLAIFAAGIFSITRALTNGGFRTGQRYGRARMVTITRGAYPGLYWLYMILAACGTGAAAIGAYKFLGILF